MTQVGQAYSTADDTQGQMFMVSSSPAYDTVTEHNSQPVPYDDHTYANIGSSQLEAIRTSRNQAYITSLRTVASAK